MNDTPSIQSIDVGSTNGRLIIDLINLFGRVANPLRVAPGVVDTELITAAVTYAGCIHGELIAMGLMEEGSQSGEEQTKLLLHNYEAGVTAGKAKVAEVEARMDAKGDEVRTTVVFGGCDDASCETCHPVRPAPANDGGEG